MLKSEAQTKKKHNEFDKRVLAAIESKNGGMQESPVLGRLKELSRNRVPKLERPIGSR